MILNSSETAMTFPRILRTVLALAILSAAAYTAAAGEKSAARALAFSGKPALGKHFLFSYRALDSIQYDMKLQGARTPPARSETQETVLSGTLTILEESPAADSKDGKTILLFRISLFLITRNGVPENTAPLNGRTARITFSGKNIRTELLEDLSANESFPFPAPDSENTGKDAKPPLAPGWKNALSSILSGFHGPPPGAVLGPDSIRKDGETWQTTSAWLRTILQQRGVESSAAQWSANARSLGITSFQGIPAVQVQYLISSAGIPGYDCKLEALYRFPASAANAKPEPPLSVTRKITEVVERILPEDNPVFSGTKFRVIRNNAAETIILPDQDPVPAGRQ